MSPKFKTTLLFLVLALLRGVSFGQNNTLLDNYIKEGISNNTALKSQQFDLEKSYKALEQAQTLFKPQVNFQMQYTLAAGGRQTSLPVGDLLNPVYNTLNRLTQSKDFNNIDNSTINFLPNNFHDTKIHTEYPVLNKEIYYNREIRKELISLEQAKIDIYKRELVKNIKMAYIQYCQAQKAVEIYKNALGLVNENLRVNQKLLKNEVATQAPVLKAKVEVSKVENSIVEAENAAKNAAAYFNFLLNKPLDSTIQIDFDLIHQVTESLSPPRGVGTGSLYPLPQTNDILQNREELAQLQSGQRTAALQLKMAESYKIPKIGVALDMGFQGFGFKVWDKQAYFLLGLQMQLPIYTAGANKLKMEQTQLDIKKLDAQKTDAVQQIQLQIQVAQTNLETAQKALVVNETEMQSAREYYRLMERRYREGQALQIELTDARTQLTTAELKQSVAKFNVILRGVELERAEASFKF